MRSAEIYYRGIFDKMKIIDFFECENRIYWLEQISKTDWRSGKYLYELLRSNSFFEKAGDFAKLLLLTDNDLLLAFCTVSEKKYDIESALCPWIGFVYTFPEYRGKRYSKLLINFAEKIVYEQGFEKVYISTNHIGLYEKYGYEFYQLMTDWRGEKQRIYCKSVTESDVLYNFQC